MSDDSCGCGCNTKPATTPIGTTPAKANEDCACGCECCGDKEPSKEGALA